MESAVEYASLINAVVGFFGLRKVTTDEISATVMNLAPALAPSLTSQDIARAIVQIETQLNIKIEIGVGIAAGHTPWLAERKARIQWLRWNAYANVLRSKNIPPASMQVMGERADLILDYAGDPEQVGKWARRGLVIGDVQSGKTSNYLGLFNKAADAGYKVFILLAGSTDDLRKQTQKRVDEGFVGRDSTMITEGLTGVGARYQIGVGKLGVTAQSFTTVQKDFQSSLVRNINLEIEALNSPVVFVVKKNKKILDNLANWLQPQVQEGNAKLSMPMMLLDDEADYASINTNDPDQDPTAINSAVVNLLGLFDKNAYVGFTATPFANVLIDDEAPEDLFPKDFIFALESPDNYFGPEQMFDEDIAGKFISPVVDAEASFPFKHKPTHVVGAIPSSLKQSVINFFLVNAIRDLRKQESQHRSMLVNVSRFKLVQAQVFNQLLAYVSDLKNAINFSNANNSEVLLQIQAEFNKEFVDCGFSWVEVASQLPLSVEPISVQIVNSDNKAGWDGIFDKGPARVIAIGGDVLSRGLTLEGLSSSYFIRRSVAYDTLMQMGRWFGYRQGYLDLCRLWIDQEVASWYWFISKAISELRDDLYTMRNAGLTPKEFGLAVLRHPGSVLTVTAFNKQRHAERAQKVSMRNFDVETVLLPNDETLLEDNFESFKLLLGSLQSASESITVGSSLLWRNVNPAIPASFISMFHAHKGQPLLLDGQVAEWIRTTSLPWMQEWDVAIMGGQGSPAENIGESFSLPVRLVRSKPGVISINGRRMRLSGKTDIGIGLSPARREAMMAGESEVNEKTIRRYLERPILTIYPIEVRKNAEVDEGETWGPYLGLESGNPLIGMHVSFPNMVDGTEHEDDTMTYVVNKPWQRLQGYFTPDFGEVTDD